MSVAGVATTNYCYSAGDRLVSTNGAQPLIAIAYDQHGNTTGLGGDTYTYDASDRHTGTGHGATSVTYTRDATNRIVERNAAGR